MSKLLWWLLMKMTGPARKVLAAAHRHPDACQEQGQPRPQPGVKGIDPAAGVQQGADERADRKQEGQGDKQRQIQVCPDSGSVHGCLVYQAAMHSG